MRLCLWLIPIRSGLLLALMALLVLPVPSSYAATITLFANLTEALEVPPTGSPGTGQGTVVLDTTLHTMHVDVTFSGLFGTTASGLPSGTTAAHIHCCLPSPLATGLNVMVATTVPTFPGFPLGVTSGTYSRDFNLLDAATYNPDFITSAFNPSGTIAGAEAALVAGLLAQETYLNIHTTRFPGGEIRGFLEVPGPVVGAGLPGLLLASGCLLAWWSSRQKHRRAVTRRALRR